MTRKPKTVRERFVLPIYGANILLSVSPDVYKARRAESLLFGKLSEGEDAEWIGLCASFENRYGVFLRFDCVSHGVLAHEIFHLVHRILGNRDLMFDPQNHEAFAYLSQWLTDEIYARLKKHRIEVL